LSKPVRAGRSRDQHHARGARSFARHALRGIAPQFAAATLVEVLGVGRRVWLGLVHRLGVMRPPPAIAEMRDDLYRSLEAFARMAGGYSKVKEAYSDFRWADFFRREIDGPLDTQDLFADALARAIRLARSNKARDLPGFVGCAAKAPSAAQKPASARIDTAPPGNVVQTSSPSPSPLGAAFSVSSLPSRLGFRPR
jgi:hypothetical protein